MRILEGHGHWVNTLALNTDSVLRSGANDHTGKEYEDKVEGKFFFSFFLLLSISIYKSYFIYIYHISIYIAQAVALERYNNMLKHVGGIERLLSGSDDFTMFLWEPTKSKKSLTRMTGHGQLINVVSFSPDGRLIASASFDKSIKLWNAITGV